MAKQVEKTNEELRIELMHLKNSAKGKKAITELMANRAEMINKARAEQEKNK